MIDIFLIVVVLVMMVVLTIINIYILAHYSHPLESKFGESLFAKILIIIALLLVEIMILLLPLDVSNVQEDGGLDMKGFWYTMTMTSMIFIFIILPTSYFYYETEGDELKSRIWHAIGMEFFFLLFSGVLIFVTFFTLAKANIPFQDVTCDMSAATTSDGTTAVQSLTSTFESSVEGGTKGSDVFTVDISFAVYLIGLMAFIGYWILIIFLGVGISAVPIDLIIQFRTRPKRLTVNQFNNRRNQLLRHVKGLRQEGKRIESIKEGIDKTKGWKGFKDRRVFGRDLTKFEAHGLIAEREFVILENTAKLSKIEPGLYWLKLFFGILLVILSLVWFIHIFLWVLIRPDDKAIHPFLNNMLEGVRAGHVEFLSTTMFALLALYLLWCTIKGNIKFGLRFFCITFFPMRPNETFLSSLIFNVFMINVWSFALIQYLTLNFSMFARNTDAFLIFIVQVENAWFYKFFYSNNLFTWVLIIWIILAFFYLIFKPRERLSLEDQVMNKDLEANRN